MTIRELRKILGKYPNEYEVQVTWESCTWNIEENNIYEAKINDYSKKVEGLILIDADNNDYKDFYQGKEE